MTHLPRFAPLAATLGLGLLLAGCSGDSEPVIDQSGSAEPVEESFGAAGTEGTVTVSGTITLTGAESVSGGFSNSAWTAQSNCQAAAQYGSGGGGFGPSGSFMVPGPYFGEPLSDGTDYDTSLELSGYDGPGDYDGVAYSITVGGIADGVRYNVDQAESATASVAPDGSGSLVFESAPSDSGDSSVSGRITWTCETG